MPENSKLGLGLQLASPSIGRIPAGCSANGPKTSIEPGLFGEYRHRNATMPHIVFLPDEPTISVVVPFYGTDVSALVKCVESLLDQDYAKDRITIIVYRQ